LATRAAIKIDAGKFEEEILGGFFTHLGQSGMESQELAASRQQVLY